MKTIPRVPGTTIFISALLVAATVGGGYALPQSGDLGGQSALDLFQRALAAERASGNLQGAIQLYEQVVDRAGADRALAARALLRIAECYGTLGDPQAQGIYRRILRDYADQADSANVARARVDAAVTQDRPRAGTTALRKVWASEDVLAFFTGVSADGRYVLRTETSHGHLVLQDLMTGGSRLLTSEPGYFYTIGATLSRDGRRAVFNLQRPDAKWELRVTDLRGAGMPTSQRLLDTADLGIIYPQDWSADGRSLAVLIERDRAFQLGILSFPESRLRVLKSLEWRSPSRVSFAPGS